MTHGLLEYVCLPGEYDYGSGAVILWMSFFTLSKVRTPLSVLAWSSSCVCVCVNRVRWPQSRISSRCSHTVRIRGLLLVGGAPYAPQCSLWPGGGNEPMLPSC